jgi:hypothetical protein
MGRMNTLCDTMYSVDYEEDICLRDQPCQGNRNNLSFWNLNLYSTTHTSSQEQLNNLLIKLATIPFGIFCLPISYIKIVMIQICKTIILPVVLYGCENRSLTLREGCRLMVFETNLPKIIFRRSMDE